MATLAELRQQRADAYDEEDMFLVAELDREIRLSKIDARLEELDKEIKGAKTLDEAQELGEERTALRGEITSIKNEAKQAEKEESYVHRGIAKRTFERNFTLSEDIIVKGCELVNGLLTVELEKVIPEEKKSRLIPIGKSGIKQIN